MYRILPVWIITGHWKTPIVVTIDDEEILMSFGQDPDYVYDKKHTCYNHNLPTFRL